MTQTSPTDSLGNPVTLHDPASQQHGITRRETAYQGTQRVHRDPDQQRGEVALEERAVDLTPRGKEKHREQSRHEGEHGW